MNLSKTYLILFLFNSFLLANDNFFRTGDVINNRDHCDNGYVDDCSGDGDCCSEGWIGDGYADCEDQASDCDLSCYDNDGGDCPENSDDGGNSDETVDYDSEIQPIFDNHCGNCHLGNSSSGLNLSSYDNLMAGGNHGDAVIPYNSPESILIQKLGENSPFGEQMPRNNQALNDETITLIALWIDQGALSTPPTCEDYLACNYQAQAECIYAEENFDCDGNCLFEVDCAGICSGESVVDECGVCNGDGAQYQCWDQSFVCNAFNCPHNPDDGDSYSLSDLGKSSQVLLDVINPSINITEPNGGEEYNSGETIQLTISYNEDNLPAQPLAVYLAAGNGIAYEFITDTISIDSLFIILPDINTNEASIKVYMIDLFGNSSFDISDNAFTIGTPEEEIEIDSYSINDSGQSSVIILDTVTPIVTLTSPNGGEEFDPGSNIDVTWTFNEMYPMQNPFNVYISEELGEEFYLLLSDIDLAESTTITLPDINSESALLKISMVDQFGNYNDDVTDNTFSIGSSQIDDIVQYPLFDMGQSSQITMDVVDPTITVNYPNGGELIDNYEDCNVSCPAYDDHLSYQGLTIEVSFALGGWFAEVASGINPAYSSDYNIDLSGGGNVPESIYGLMRATVTDDFGNSKTDMSNGYFILGEPAGDIGLNWLDEEEFKVVVDWGWIENHDITITAEAIESIQGYDNLIIYDDSGIHTETCDNDSSSTGFVDLKTLNVSELSEDVPITLDCGFDYCDLGGQRVVGYTPGNEIKFMVNIAGEDTFYSLAPVDNNYITQQLSFSSSMNIISEFTFTGENFSIPDYTPLISIDERDFDGFSIYNKVTSVREECETPGTGENDGWCFESEIEGVTTYVSQLPAMQESSNVKYRVWLLDNTGEEILKTLDTDGIDHYIDLDDIYDKSLAFGWNWFSLNMSADDMAINTTLSSLFDAGIYIKSQSAYADYYLAQGVWSGNLDYLDNVSMYKINLTGDSGNITYEGLALTPSEVPLTINNGWNWISYIPNESIDINTALASLGSDAIYIKSQSGYADYYPAQGVWSGNISTLNPKDGYMINATNASTLTYPDPGSFLSSHMINEEPSINEYHWNFDYGDFQNNGSATIIIDDPDLNVNPGDQIAAFYNDKCRGVAIGKETSLSDKIIFHLMFYGDEIEANFTFKYYDVSENLVHNLENEIVYYPDIHLNNILEPLSMGKNEVISLKLSSPYPNPFNPVTTIPYSIPEDVANLRINIYDITGRLVDQIYKGNQTRGNHKLLWNASRYASGIYFVKMITNKNTITRKLVLIK